MNLICHVIKFCKVQRTKRCREENIGILMFLFRSSRTLGVTPRPPYRGTSICTPCINSPYHWTGSVYTTCRPPRPPVSARSWHDNAQIYKCLYLWKYPYVLSRTLIKLTLGKGRGQRGRERVQTMIICQHRIFPGLFDRVREKSFWNV